MIPNDHINVKIMQILQFTYIFICHESRANIIVYFVSHSNDRNLRNAFLTVFVLAKAICEQLHQL